MFPVSFHLSEAEPIILPEPPYSVPAFFPFGLILLMLVPVILAIIAISIPRTVVRNILIVGIAVSIITGIFVLINSGHTSRQTSVENSDDWYEQSARLLDWKIGEEQLKEWDLLSVIQEGQVIEFYEDAPIEMFDPVENVTMLKHRGLMIDGRVATFIYKNAANQEPLRQKREEDRSKVDAVLRGDPGLTKYYESLSDEEKKKFIDSVISG